MPLFRVQREFVGWEEVVIEADTESEALNNALDDWEELDPYVVDSYNYTGENWIGAK